MDVLKTLVSGVVLIGLVTAAFYPGRQTVAGINAITKGTQGILYTAESGKQ